MSASSIEWTDETWNPTLGCSVASPGCDHCYAARVALRGMTEAHKGLAEMVDGVPRFTGRIQMMGERLDTPLRWRKPRRVFVDSMSDLFHEGVADDFRRLVWDVMARTPHTYQVLTKRSQRLAKVFRNLDGRTEPLPALPNVWLGVSIEDDRYTFRARHLRETPAAVRFLSLEPLLGPLPSLNLTGINWVIVGGESGPRARPMHPEWVRDIRDRCVAAGVPFFFKQWGEWAPNSVLTSGARGAWLTADGALHALDASGIGSDDPLLMRRPGKKAAGRRLDGRTWDEYPEVQA